MLAFLLSAWGIAKRVASLVPWQVWVAAAAVALAWLWLGAHDRQLTEAVTAKRDAYWQGREKAANDRYAADMARKRAEVADLVLAGIAARDRLEAVIRAQAQSFDAEISRIKTRRPAYVTPLADSRCTVPRGFVLQFNAGAASANGARAPDAPGAADPRPDLVEAPAGIALSAVADAVTDTQRALGECRQQVTGWQRFYSEVLVPWHESLRNTLKGAP